MPRSIGKDHDDKGKSFKISEAEKELATPRTKLGTTWRRKSVCDDQTNQSNSKILATCDRMSTAATA